MTTTHPCEPGLPGFIRELIQHTGATHFTKDYQALRWTCSYQGESDYEYKGQRLKFRYGKTAWQLGYWNYANEEDFEAQHNGNWGLVTRGNEPVDADVLALFRAEHYPSAATGYYCHTRHRWVECKPTNRQPGHASYKKEMSKVVT